MEIFDHQDQQLLTGHDLQERAKFPRHAVGRDTDEILPGSPCGPSGKHGQLNRPGRCDLRDHGREVVEDARQVHQDIEHRIVGVSLRIARKTAADDRLGARRRGVPHRSGGERGLADARFAGDEGDLRFTGRRQIQQVGEVGFLGVPANDRWVRLVRRSQVIGGGACKRLLGDRRGEAVASTRHGRDETALRQILIERLAQHADVVAKVSRFDDHSGPSGFRQLRLADDTFRLSGERDQDIQRPAADADGPAASFQPPFGRRQPERAERDRPGQRVRAGGQDGTLSFGPYPVRPQPHP